MSLILDALNRSRQDTDQVPGLATQHYLEDDGDEGGRVRRYLPWVALLLALAVIGWLLVDRHAGPADNPTNGPALPAQDARAARVEMAAGEPASARVVPAAAAPESATAGTEPALEKSTAAVATQAALMPEAEPESGTAVVDLYRQQQVEQPLAASPAKPDPVLDKSVHPVIRQAEAEVAAPAGSQTRASPRDEQPVDIEKMVLKARDELHNARLAEHPAPFIAELSQQTKDAIPTIFYGRHDYSGDRAQSSVMLNGKTIRVGGTAASGVKVEEILPDSVVLSYRGTQFRLRALNSWVNL